MKNFYLLLGPEDFDAQNYIDTLYKEASKNRNIEKKYLYAFDENDIESAISDILAPSLFGEEYFIILENCEALNEKNAAKIENAISAATTDTFFIVRSNEFTISKRLEKICKKENKKVFYLLFESQKKDFVSNSFKEKGYFLDNNAIIGFLGLVEQDKKSILLSRDKLLLQLSSNNINEKNINIDTIYHFLDYDREEDGRSVFASIAKKDIVGAMKGVENIILSSSTPYMFLVPSLILYTRRALSYIDNLENNREPWLINVLSSGQSMLKNPFDKNAITAFTKNYSKEKILRILKCLLNLDIQIRKISSPVLQKVYFQTKLARAIYR